LKTTHRHILSLNVLIDTKIYKHPSKWALDYLLLQLAGLLFLFYSNLTEVIEIEPPTG